MGMADSAGDDESEHIRNASRASWSMFSGAPGDQHGSAGATIVEDLPEETEQGDGNTTSLTPTVPSPAPIVRGARALSTMP